MSVNLAQRRAPWETAPWETAPSLATPQARRSSTPETSAPTLDTDHLSTDLLLQLMDGAVVGFPYERLLDHLALSCPRCTTAVRRLPADIKPAYQRLAAHGEAHQPQVLLPCPVSKALATLRRSSRRDLGPRRRFWASRALRQQRAFPALVLEEAREIALAGEPLGAWWIELISNYWENRTWERVDGSALQVRALGYLAEALLRDARQQQGAERNAAIDRACRAIRQASARVEHLPLEDEARAVLLEARARLAQTQEQLEAALRWMDDAFTVLATKAVLTTQTEAPPTAEPMPTDRRLELRVARAQLQRGLDLAPQAILDQLLPGLEELTFYTPLTLRARFFALTGEAALRAAARLDQPEHRDRAHKLHRLGNQHLQTLRNLRQRQGKPGRHHTCWRHGVGAEIWAWENLLAGLHAQRFCERQAAAWLGHAGRTFSDLLMVDEAARARLLQMDLLLCCGETTGARRIATVVHNLADQVPWLQQRLQSRAASPGLTDPRESPDGDSHSSPESVDPS